MDDDFIPFKAVKKRARLALLQTNPHLAEEFLENLLHNLKDSQIENKLEIALLLNVIRPRHEESIKIMLEYMLNTEDDIERRYATEWLIENATYSKYTIQNLTPYLSTEKNEQRIFEIAKILSIISGNKPENRYIAKKALDVIFNIIINSHYGDLIKYVSNDIELIAQQNPKFINYIVEKLTDILNQNHDEYFTINSIYAEEVYLNFAESLFQISPNNRLSVTTLVSFLGKNDLYLDRINVHYFDIITNCFNKYGKNNAVLAYELSLFINSKNPDDLYGDEGKKWVKILETISKIIFNDSSTIKIISEKLRRTTSENKRLEIAKCLGKITPNNSEEHSQAIIALDELARFSQDKYLQASTARYWAQIEPENPTPINILIELLQKYQNKWISYVLQLNLNPATATEEVRELYIKSKEYDDESPETEFFIVVSRN